MGDTVDLRGMHAPDRDEPLASVAAVEAAAVAMATGVAPELATAKAAAPGVVQAAASAEMLWDSYR